MKKLFGLTIVACILFACNQGQQPAAGATDMDRDSTTMRHDTYAGLQQVAGCYTAVSGRDTAGLRLEERDSNLNGALSYNYYEKDRNEGSFQGEVQDGMLTGWYLFRSEGVMSFRQVAWQIRGSELWPATGEMEQRNDTMLFRDIKAVRFDSSLVFRKVPCVL